MLLQKLLSVFSMKCNEPFSEEDLTLGNGEGSRNSIS